MKKFIFGCLFLFSTLSFSSMDIWKTEIQITPSFSAVLYFDPSSADVSKNGKLWSVKLKVQADNVSTDFISVTSGCDKMRGKTMLFDENGQSIGSNEPIEWSLNDEHLPATLAKFTCAAAYSKGIIVQGKSL